MKKTFHILSAELNAAFRSKRMWAAFLLALLLFLRPVIRIWRTGGAHLYSPMEMLSVALALSDFTPFAVIFCTIPYATSFAGEYRTGYLRLILGRTGARRYACSKTISVFLSGAFVMSSLMGVAMLFCSFTGGMAETAESLEFLTDTIWQRNGWLTNAPYKVYLGRWFLAFLFGGLWALVSLWISTLIPNIQLTLIVPFVLYQVLWFLLVNAYFNPLYMLRADDARIPSLGFVVAFQLFWIGLAAILSYRGIKRRCRHA